MRALTHVRPSFSFLHSFCTGKISVTQRCLCRRDRLNIAAFDHRCPLTHSVSGLCSQRQHRGQAFGQCRNRAPFFIYCSEIWSQRTLLLLFQASFFVDHSCNSASVQLGEDGFERRRVLTCTRQCFRKLDDFTVQLADHHNRLRASRVIARGDHRCRRCLHLHPQRHCLQ